MALLLSWFGRGDIHCRDFAHAWIDSQTREDWVNLLGRALEKGLEMAAYGSRELRRLTLLNNWNEILAKRRSP